jgi:hypothetical protein
MVHRKKSDATGAGSMFEDRDGAVILEFNHVADVAVEGMHLLGGGVFKDVNIMFKFMATRVRLDPTIGNSATKSILNPDVEERVRFYNKFVIREQERHLRSEFALTLLFQYICLIVGWEL